MYDQHFYWRGGGWVGGSSERCLKWGSIRDLSRNILKQGVGKDKVVRREEGGFEGVTPENFNHTLTIIIPSRFNPHATPMQRPENGP